MTILQELICQLRDYKVDTESMSPEQLAECRKDLGDMTTIVGVKMAETSTKEHVYDDSAIKEYIEDILADGFNLNETKLGDYPQFVDAQRLRRWQQMISDCVDSSEFSSKKFKVHSLRLLRTNIAQSKTLHELRRAVTLMISPLQLWRDHKAMGETYSKKNLIHNDKEIDSYVDKLLLEIEDLKVVCAERKRILDELIGCYDEGIGDISLLRNCEAAKSANKLSDEEVAKVFGINRVKLNRLRKSVEAIPSVVAQYAPPSDAYWEVLRKDSKHQKTSKKLRYPEFSVGQVWKLTDGENGVVVQVLDEFVVYQSSNRVVTCNKTGESLYDNNPSMVEEISVWEKPVENVPTLYVGKQLETVHGDPMADWKNNFKKDSQTLCLEVVEPACTSSKWKAT